MNRLPCAQAVLCNLQVLEQRSGESHIAVKARNVILGWQGALQQGSDQVAAFQPDRVGIHRIVSAHSSEFAQAGIGHTEDRRSQTAIDAQPLLNANVESVVARIGFNPVQGDCKMGS